MCLTFLKAVISTAIESNEGCSLPDVDPGRSTNRYYNNIIL